MRHVPRPGGNRADVRRRRALLADRRVRDQTELESGEHAALFGRFTYTSVVLSQTVTSPFAILGRVKNGVCHFMQFMEDTLATTTSFRSGGVWTIRSDPDGAEIEV